MEIIKLTKDIEDRASIINSFTSNNTLDRERVIGMILDKRKEDPRVAIATAAYQTGRKVLPIEMVSDESLVQELLLQIETLKMELLEKSGKA